METSCYTHRLRRMLSATCVFGLVLLLSVVGGPVSFAQSENASETATVKSQNNLEKLPVPPEEPPARPAEGEQRGASAGTPANPEVDKPATPNKPDPLPVPPNKPDPLPVPPDDERGASAEAPNPPTPPGPGNNQGVGPDGTPPGQSGENLNNRGSIKIQRIGTEAAVVSEHPHPGCEFQLALFGFDAKTLDVTYTLQAPTGAGLNLPLGPGSVTVVSGRGNDRVGVVTYSESQIRNALAAAFGSDWASQAHPQQGFHVKVTVRDPRLPAAGKHKVFWLDCPVGETSAGGDETTGGVVGGDETTGGVVGGDETTGGVVGGDETTGGVVGGDETTGGVVGGDETTGGVSGDGQVAGGNEAEAEGGVLGEDRVREDVPPAEAGAAADHVHDHDHVHVVEHDNLPAHEHPHAEAHGHAHEHADHGQVAAAGQVTGISVPNRVDAGGGGMAGGGSSLPMAPILATAVWVLGLGYLRRTPKVVATP